MLTKIHQNLKKFFFSENPFSLIIRLIIFYFLAAELIVFIIRRPIFDFNLAFVEPIRPYVQERFLNTGFRRIIYFAWSITLYLCWIKTIDKYRKIPNVLIPSTSKLVYYCKGFLIGAAIELFAYFMDHILGGLRVEGVVSNYKHIFINILVVWTFSTFNSFGEELIFRGYFLELFSRRWNGHIACFIQAILFGASHLNGGRGLDMFLSTAFAGLVLGYTYLVFKNVYACVAMHSVSHLSNLLYSTKIFKIEGNYPHPIFLWFQSNYGLFGILSLTIALVILIIIYEKNNKFKKIS